MSKPRILIRADGGAHVGMGHIVRCHALANLLRDEYEIIFFISASAIAGLRIPEGEKFETHPVLAEQTDFFGRIGTSDVVVLDGYGFNREYQTTVRKLAYRLVVIDDQANGPFFCDAIINHVIGLTEKDFDVDTRTRLYLGLRYRLLRKEFFRFIGHQKQTSTLRNALLCLGGSQQEEVQEILIDKMTEAGIEKINVIGTSTSHGNGATITFRRDLDATQMSDAMRNHDLVICPPSSLCYEAFTVGSCVAIGYLNASQKKVYDTIKDFGLAIQLGDLHDPDIDMLKKIINDHTAIQEMLNRQSALFSQPSAPHLKSVFDNLLENYLTPDREIYLSQPTISDLSSFIKWKGDAELSGVIMATARVLNEIEAAQWLHQNIADPNQLFLGIYNSQDQIIGLTRLMFIDWKRKSAEFGMYIGDFNERGKGYGTTVLRLTLERARRLGLQEIVLKVKKDNIIAIKTYAKAGFIEQAPEHEKIKQEGPEIIRMKLKL